MSADMENEIRVLAQIEVAAARREIEWISDQLERLRVDRNHLAKREERLLADRAEAHRRMAKAQEALS